MAILVTGGAGFIGSHTCVLLLQAGHDIVVLDNFHNSHAEAIKRVEKITGKSVDLICADVNDKNAVEEIFQKYSITAVIHFAGLKAVGESNQIPLSYYHTNVGGTIALCEIMAKYHCGKLVFSSSATVYGDPETVPIVESSRTQATNPYGRSKLMVEQILSDLQKSQPDFWNITLLRYFNPIGAHPSGLIGEDPNDIPNNLLPYVAQVASGKLQMVNVFGNDYNTPDGTGVRDYIHVMDLSAGHLRALEHLERTPPGLHIFNLGTGRGYSVLEIIEKFREISGQPIPYKIAPRRSGDIAVCYADPTKAQSELGWRCEYDLDDMIRHTWLWQKNNPRGYQS
jgi:UDP-glucose 4-epimerase